MKKISLVIGGLLVVALFLVGCASESEQVELVDEEGNLVGEATWWKPKMYRVDSTTLIKPELNLDLTEIKKNDFVWLSGVNTLLQYKGADKISSTSPKIKFKNLMNGETLEYAIQNDQVTIRLGGQSFKVKLLNPTTSDSPLQVDFDGDGVMETKPQLFNLYKK